MVSNRAAWEQIDVSWIQIDVPRFFLFQCQNDNFIYLFTAWHDELTILAKFYFIRDLFIDIRFVKINK